MPLRKTATGIPMIISRVSMSMPVEEVDIAEATGTKTSAPESTYKIDQSLNMQYRAAAPGC